MTLLRRPQPKNRLHQFWLSSRHSQTSRFSGAERFIVDKVRPVGFPETLVLAKYAKTLFRVRRLLMHFPKWSKRWVDQIVATYKSQRHHKARIFFRMHFIDGKNETNPTSAGDSLFKLFLKISRTKFVQHKCTSLCIYNFTHDTQDNTRAGMTSVYLWKFQTQVITYGRDKNKIRTLIILQTSVQHGT